MTTDRWWQSANPLQSAAQLSGNPPIPVSVLCYLGGQDSTDLRNGRILSADSPTRRPTSNSFDAATGNLLKQVQGVS